MTTDKLLLLAVNLYISHIAYRFVNRTDDELGIYITFTPCLLVPLLNKGITLFLSEHNCKILLIGGFIIPVTIFRSSFHTLMYTIGSLPFFPFFLLKTIWSQPLTEQLKYLKSIGHRQNPVAECWKLAFPLALTHQFILFIYHHQSPHFYFFIQFMRMSSRLC